MKTTYLAVAGILGLSAALYILRFRKKLKMDYSNVAQSKKTVLGEKHIRGIMKKSKLAI